MRIISALLALPGFVLLPNPTKVVRGLIELLKRRPVIGGDVFDLQIVATMLANDIQRLYTFNVEDFRVFPELAVISP